MILATLAAVALAAPKPDYDRAGRADIDSSEEIGILRQDLIMEENGRFDLDVETENGINHQQSGSPDGPEDAVVKSGTFS